MPEHSVEPNLRFNRPPFAFAAAEREGSLAKAWLRTMRMERTPNTLRNEIQSGICSRSNITATVIMQLREKGLAQPARLRMQ
jgi:hypothetical protein